MYQETLLSITRVHLHFYGGLVVLPLLWDPPVSNAWVPLSSHLVNSTVIRRMMLGALHPCSPSSLTLFPFIFRGGFALSFNRMLHKHIKDIVGVNCVRRRTPKPLDGLVEGNQNVPQQEGCSISL